MTNGVLILLRHGQTEYNQKKLMTGQRDVPLTPEGERQADAAGALLKGLRIDKAYSSTLSRAFNTAARALTAAGLSIPVEQRDALAELDTGDFTGRNHHTDPEILAFNQDRHYHKKLPNGESMEDVVARIKNFFDADVLPRLQRGETVLIVSHAGIVRAFDLVLGLDAAPKPGETGPKRKTVLNAAPEVFEFQDTRVTARRFLKPPSMTG